MENYNYRQMLRNSTYLRLEPQSKRVAIVHRFPFKTLISINSELVKNYTGGVFYDTTNATEIDHDISVVGYGIDKATGWKYWLIRNSWGTYWVKISLWPLTF